MFRLQLPLSDISWIEKYLSVGLDEQVNFYGWYVPFEYENKHWKFTKVNSRWAIGSFQDLQELQDAISIIHEKGHLFSYVCNANNVSSNDESMDDNIWIVNSHINPDSIILTDLSLRDKIHKDIKVHISSFWSIYNSFAISFIRESYKDIKRIIFPRDILLSDIETIRQKHKDLEYEIFAKNSWCYHSSHCTSHHLNYKTFLCNREKWILWSKGIVSKKKINDLQESKLHCKVCSLYAIKDKFWKNSQTKMYLKIPWREMKIENLVKDAKFVNDSIRNSEDSKSMKETLSKNISLHRKLYGSYCDYKKCEYFINWKKYET